MINVIVAIWKQAHEPGYILSVIPRRYVEAIAFLSTIKDLDKDVAVAYAEEYAALRHVPHIYDIYGALPLKANQTDNMRKL